jgi:hypothetical protein
MKNKNKHTRNENNRRSKDYNIENNSWNRTYIIDYNFIRYKNKK